MEHYVTGAAIRALREKKGCTQKQLADQLSVSDKTVSKWETGRGLPDITLLEPLARALSVSVAGLLSGDCAVNRNRSGNMQRGHFYVCPVCGNFLFALGEGAYSCCGITLPPLEAEEPDHVEDVSTSIDTKIEAAARVDPEYEPDTAPTTLSRSTIRVAAGTASFGEPWSS